MTQQEVVALFNKLHSDWYNKPLMVLPNSIANHHGQCFDLAVEWAHRLGVPNYPGNPSPFPYVNAYQIYTEFGSFQAQYFDRIENTPDYVVQTGDIVLWDKRLNGGAGHVALGTKDADIQYFISYDENWNPSDWFPKDEWHDYDTGPVLGCLRFKITNSPTPPMDNRTSFADQSTNAFPDKLGINNDSTKITQQQIKDFIAWIKSNVDRAGKWDSLCIKAGLTGDTSKVTVQQLFDKIQSQVSTGTIRAKAIQDCIDALHKMT